MARGSRSKRADGATPAKKAKRKLFQAGAPDIYMSNGKRGSYRLPHSPDRDSVRWLGKLRELLLNPHLADGPDDIFWLCHPDEISLWNWRVGDAQARGRKVAESRLQDFPQPSPSDLDTRLTPEELSEQEANILRHHRPLTTP